MAFGNVARGGDLVTLGNRFLPFFSFFNISFLFIFNFDDMDPGVVARGGDLVTSGKLFILLKIFWFLDFFAN